ncbi:MAG: hypothetical protein ACD_73C00256G0007 [uncultured bacterium]|nr:MAG: hypothetical protein ACD_73C00256G0007 [uncultured bacterium]
MYINISWLYIFFIFLTKDLYLKSVIRVKAMSVEKITEQDKKTIDAQVLRIKQDALITKKLTNQLDASAAPTINELIAKQKEAQISNNNLANSKTDVKNVTSLQIKKAQLNERIDLVNEKLGLASSFMKKFVKFMQEKKANADQVEEFMHQMTDIKQIAEKELTHLKDSSDLAKSNEMGDLRFAGVLKNMYSDPNKAQNSAQKSFLEKLKFVSDANKAFKELNAEKMTKKTLEKELEDARINNIIPEKQEEASRELKQTNETIEKHNAEIIKPEVKYEEEKIKNEEHQKLIEKNREKLLKVLPFLDEKKRFFEYILGDKLEQFKSKLKKDEDNQKFIIERQERDKIRFETYLEKRIQQKEDKFHNNQPLISSHKSDDVLGGDDKSKIKTLKKSLIVSELNNDEKNIDELDNEVKKQFQAISKMMDSISNSFVDENEISNLDKTAEATLQHIDQLRKKLELQKEDLPDDRKIEDEIIDANKPQANIDLDKAFNLVQKLTAQSQIDKVYGVQKKMTPWVVQQLIF